MAALIRPHGGGPLKPLLAPASDRIGELKRAQTLTKVPLTSREVSDLFILAMGAYTPLTGFMGQEDWHGCCTNMTTSTGLFWPIPITVSCDGDLAGGIGIGQDVALVDGVSLEILAIQTVTDKYAIDKELECKEVFGTTDPAHPGVGKVMAQPPINLGGRVVALSEGPYPGTYQGLYRRPAETRALFEKNGWSNVAAFQTRNPMHRSHEYLAKVALEVCDGLLIHQVLGTLKRGDIPADVRVNAVAALVKNYFVADTVIQAGYPIEMRYAGPREALLHALLRQNFGCTHLVIGRDHAGVGSYYGPYDSQRIFDMIPSGSLDIEPLKIDITFYCYKCKAMATAKTCPHSSDQRLTISGTRLREMFARREPIPEEFSRPEVVAILQAYYDGPDESDGRIDRQRRIADQRNAQ
jgi:sulfate adenylyltransferase